MTWFLILIAAEAHSLLQRRVVLRDRAIAVDDFPQDFSVELATSASTQTEALRKAA